jgi:hypothetical protein
MTRILTLLIFVFTIVFPFENQISFAETIYSSLYGFSIDIPDDWSKRKPKKSWTLFSYAKLGSGENMNLNVLNADGLSSVKQITLSQTFHPYYDYVIILQKAYKKAYETDFLYCVYKLKESALKKKIEGKYKLQYYIVQWVTEEKLFTVTFTDSENNFPKNIDLFRKITDSINLHK